MNRIRVGEQLNFEYEGLKVEGLVTRYHKLNRRLTLILNTECEYTIVKKVDNLVVDEDRIIIKSREEDEWVELDTTQARKGWILSKEL